MPTLVFLLLLILLSGGCGKRERELTFAVGGAPAEVAYWENLIREFEEREGLKVRILRQPADTDLRRQTLVIALSSKKEDPDLFLMDVVWVGQFIASGWLEELRGVDTEPFLENALKVGMREGKLYALPVYVDCGLLYYREDLLRKYGCGVPDTWESLLRCSVRAQEGERRRVRDFYAFLWQGAQYEGLVCTFLEFSASAGGGLDRIYSEPNLRALRFMVDLIHRYRISPPNTYTEMREEKVRITFQSGRALFERNWPYAWKLHNSEGSPVKGKVGVTLLPRFEGGRHASCLGGWHVGISRFSDRKEEAFKLLKFITSKEVQRRLSLGLGWNPGRRDVYGEIAEENPHMDVIRRACENAVPRPTSPYYLLFSEVLRRYVNSALSGKMSPEEALRRAQEDVDRLGRFYR